MKRERAVDVLKWGVYSKQPPTSKERVQALRMLAADPSIGRELGWTKKGQTV